MSALHDFKICDEAARTDIESLKNNKAEATHKHTAGDINGGMIPVQYGGTGRSSHAEHSVLVAGTSDQTFISNVQAQKGAFYARSNVENPMFGTLPADMGGTGNTSLQATRNSMGLGNTTGALPIANGGTGATTAENALGMLGAAPVGHGHDNIKSDKCSIELNDRTIDIEADTILINGREYNKNNILVECQVFMNEGNGIRTFSESAGKQPNGIVLVFSYFDPDAIEGEGVKDAGWSTHFVPKSILSEKGLHTFLMAYSHYGSVYFGMKQLYISNTEISGQEINGMDFEDSNCGIKFSNRHFVLRYVIGV